MDHIRSEYKYSTEAVVSDMLVMSTDRSCRRAAVRKRCTKESKRESSRGHAVRSLHSCTSARPLQRTHRGSLQIEGALTPEAKIHQRQEKDRKHLVHSANKWNRHMPGRWHRGHRTPWEAVLVERERPSNACLLAASGAGIASETSISSAQQTEQSHIIKDWIVNVHTGLVAWIIAMTTVPTRTTMGVARRKLGI